MAVRSSWRTNVYRVSLWVICVASRRVSCSQHLVVILFLRTLALLLRGIQMGNVKDSVMVVQVWN